MLRARWYKVLHDLFGSKTRTVLIVLSMAVGCFAVGIILSARAILMEGLAQSFAAIKPSSGVVHTAELFDEAFIRSVRSMPTSRRPMPGATSRPASRPLRAYGGTCHSSSRWTTRTFASTRSPRRAVRGPRRRASFWWSAPRCR